MPVPRFDRAALLGADVHWLLDLHWAGEVVRLSTESMVVPSDDGDLPYHGGLDETRFALALSFLEQSASPASVPIEAILPVDVPARVGRGYDLAAARAELSRLVDGSAWEDRVVVLAGRIADPEWGADGEAVSFSVESLPYEDRSQFPPPRAQVDNSTWDDAGLSDSDRSRPYPWVIGRPGLDYCTGSQAIWADKRTYWHKLVVTGHACTATQVTINHDGDVGGQVVNLRRQSDATGQVVTVIDYHLDGYDNGQPNDLGADYQPGVAEDVSIFVQWDQGGGGLVGPDGTLMRGAGDVLLWALEQTTIAFDRGRVLAAAPLLDQFKLDFTIDARGVHWSWIQANLLPILPISMVEGPGGIYPVVWRYWATAADAVAHLDADSDTRIDRASRIRSDNSDLRNRLELRYGVSIRTGKHQRTARLSAYDEEKATVVVQGFGASRVRVTATRAGRWGEGIVITITDTGALSVTENVAAKTIDIDFNAGFTTTEDIVTALNALTSVSAVHLQGFSTTWSANESGQTLTTALRRSDGAAGSPYCDASQRRYAVAPAERAYFDWSAESIVVYDPATAHQVLAWMARAYAFARRRVDYLAPGEYEWLERGDVVTISDSAVHLSGQVALVDEIQVDDTGTIGVILLLLEQPDRDALEVP